MNKVADWFNGSFVDYFNNQFKRRTIGELKVPASTAREFNNSVAVVGENIAQKYIDIIVYLKYTLLTKIKFNWLLQKDQEELREVVAEAVQHAVQNRAVWQKINSSSISTSGFTINSDSTNWLLSKDALGTFAWTILQNLGIDEYEVIEEDDYQIWTETANGNYQYIGWFDAVDKELI